MRRFLAFCLTLALLSLQAGGAERTVSRGEFVCLLWELCGSVPYDVSDSFSDVERDAPYAQAAAWARGGGLALGDGTGRFWPDEPLTCGQLELLLDRADALLLDRPGGCYLPGAWPDDPVAWEDGARALEQWRAQGAIGAP